jgi:CcmD family protein
MADTFRQEGKIYVVVLGLVIILTGVILFLIRVDRKISKLEHRMGKNRGV